MQHDSQLNLVAEVDVRKVKYAKPQSLGLDFFNEIDVWAKMEFKSRKQIDRMRHLGRLDGHCSQQDLRPICYAMRERLD